MKKLSMFLIVLIAFAFSSLTVAQGTITQTKVPEFNHMIWTVPASQFDSTDVIWSPPFSLSYGAATFDAQGSVKFGAVTGGATVSTEFLMYGSADGGANYILVDSLGTVSNANATKIAVDLDDWDQVPLYKIKATNGGAANSFILGIYRE